MAIHVLISGWCIDYDHLALDLSQERWHHYKKMTKHTKLKNHCAFSIPLYFFAPSTHLSTLELAYHIMLPFISSLQQRFLLFISAATASIFLLPSLAQEMPSCANNAHQSKPQCLEAFNDVKHSGSYRIQQEHLVQSMQHF